MSGTVAGMVVDDVTNSAIGDANVSIDRISKSTKSAADGSFTITDIPAGTYSVDVNKEGFAETKNIVTIIAGQTSETTVEMTRFVPILTPESLRLTFNKQSDQISIENPGNAQLSLNMTTSQSWLTVDQSSMTLGPAEKKDLVVSADLNSLDNGEYIEEVTISFDGYSMAVPVTVSYTEEVDIVWKNWYLSVPIDNGDGKATSIFYEDIINDNLTPAEKEYFYYDETSGSYVMWTKFTGYTTSGYYELDGDAYCRTELREFWQGNQTTSDNWYMNDNETHLLESTLNVDYVEGSRGRTFIAQIHGKTSTNPGIDNGPATVKVLWENGEVEVEYYVKPPNPEGEWTSNYNAKSERVRVDDEVFTIKLKVVDGVLSWAIICEAKSINKDYVELFDYYTNGYHYDNYFKTGNYFQWKSDYVSTSQVRLYNVLTHHE